MKFDGKYVQIHWVLLALAVVIATVGVVEWLDMKLKNKADLSSVITLEQKNDIAHERIASSVIAIQLDVREISTSLKEMKR